MENKNIVMEPYKLHDLVTFMLNIIILNKITLKIDYIELIIFYKQ